MAVKLWIRALYLGLVPVASLAGIMPSATPAQAQTGSALIAQADSVSDVDPNQSVKATIWLNLHNRAQFDTAVSRLYDESSPAYHQWLKGKDFAAYAPTAAELQTVKTELVKQGLTITGTGPQNLYVTVSGSAKAVQTAFHTQIKNLLINGSSMRATTTDPALNGAAGKLVSKVTGLTPHKLRPNIAHPVDPATGRSFAGVPLAKSNGLFFSSNCFRGVQAQIFKTAGTTLPLATYVGNRYGADADNTKTGTLPPCGYSAAQLQTAYGMTDAFKKGLDGTGQTIVIVDAYGSSTIAADANTFSYLNGLPELTDANFQVYYPGGPPAATTPDNAAGWAGETSLDVEWAHAMAPGANIALVIAPSNNNDDLEGALAYALFNQLGSVVSNSYSGFEAEDIAFYPDDLVISNLISEIGAALGISVNFSSGDDGDAEALVGVKTVSDLGASPYATSIGGTSLALKANGSINFQTGWGNNITKLADSTRTPLLTPLNEGSVGGAGGGESQYFAKPSWQHHLPGQGRQQPDVSLLADPYTGAEYIYTDGGVQYVGTVGGTSLSCPMFSAVWAVTTQKAVKRYGDGTLLGQAAPVISKLRGTNALVDVVPYSTPTNVVGSIFTKSGVTNYTAKKLAQPLQGNDDFLSAIYNSPYSGSWFVLTFGMDTSLHVDNGWDNVTGFGTPSGLDFINAASK